MDEAYIVANEQQEREVLDKFGREGLVWISGREATELIPSQTGLDIPQFPYALVDVGYVAWRSIGQLKKYEIVYDGRREQQMSDKYVVSQEFMDELKEWKLKLVRDVLIKEEDISKLPTNIYDWWYYITPYEEHNNRLIAIIRWVNGEDVFEVEKPKKWVVRSKATDNDGDYRYVSMFDSYFGITYADSGKDKLENATHFDTKEEAESWANTHQEVVEVEE